MEFIKSYNFLWILIIPVFASIYYAMQLPVSYDEAWTFLNFTNKGFWETMTSYEDPNNHVFHSLLTNCTKFIPGLSNLFKIRISSVIINFIFLIVFFQSLKKHFGFKVAIVVMGLTSVLFMNIYYSYMSRGYCIVNLCFVIGLFCAFNIIKKHEIDKNWFLFGVSSFAGFATIPAYLYPFITLNFLIFIFNFKKVQHQFIANIVVVLAVFLFYLPIIQKNGLEALTNNTYVRPIGFLKTIKALPRFYTQVLSEVTGIHFLIITVLIFISCYRIYKTNNQLLKYFSLIFVLAPIFLLSVHGIIPFVRVFSYYGIVIIMIIILSFEEKINVVSLKYLFLLIIVFQCFMLFNFNCRINNYEDKDLAINIIGNKIIDRIIGNKRYLFNESLLATNLEFDLIEHGFKNYKIKEMNHVKMNADTIRNYDYIIIKLENDVTKNRKKFIETKYYNVYKIR